MDIASLLYNGKKTNLQISALSHCPIYKHLQQQCYFSTPERVLLKKRKHNSSVYKFMQYPHKHSHINKFRNLVHANQTIHKNKLTIVFAEKKGYLSEKIKHCVLEIKHTGKHNHEGCTICKQVQHQRDCFILDSCETKQILQDSKAQYHAMQHSRQGNETELNYEISKCLMEWKPSSLKLLDKKDYLRLLRVDQNYISGLFRVRCSESGVIFPSDIDINGGLKLRIVQLCIKLKPTIEQELKKDGAWISPSLWTVSSFDLWLVKQGNNHQLTIVIVTDVFLAGINCLLFQDTLLKNLSELEVIDKGKSRILKLADGNSQHHQPPRQLPCFSVTQIIGKIGKNNQFKNQCQTTPKLNSLNNIRISKLINDPLSLRQCASCHITLNPTTNPKLITQQHIPQIQQMQNIKHSKQRQWSQKHKLVPVCNLCYSLFNNNPSTLTMSFNTTCSPSADQSKRSRLFTQTTAKKVHQEEIDQLTHDIDISYSSKSGVMTRVQKNDLPDSRLIYFDWVRKNYESQGKNQENVIERLKRAITSKDYRKYGKSELKSDMTFSFKHTMIHNGNRLNKNVHTSFVSKPLFEQLIKQSNSSAEK